ncbi:MAG: hypothetical protein Q4D29_10965 [Lachnospiraceae bacterium]|nr:hypothetical protein [Lachnospiraceae bacterium]
MLYRVIYQRQVIPEGEEEMRGINPGEELCFFNEEAGIFITAVLEGKAENEKSSFVKVGEIRVESNSPDARVETTETAYTFRTNILRSMMERQVEWNTLKSFALKTERVANKE